MTELEKAARMALEVMETLNHEDSVLSGEFEKEVTALRQALEQKPADEPVALADAVFTVLEGFTLPHDVRKILEAAYYTRPQPADKEIQRLSALVRAQQITINKLEQQPAAPEPSHSDVELAAQIMSDCGCSTANERLLDRITERLAKHRPQPAAWVGLTDEEICFWFQENTALTNEAAMRITRAIEAKLKEKNNG